MDQNGEAEGNYTLLSMKVVTNVTKNSENKTITNKSIEMQIVGAFQQTAHDVPVWTLLTGEVLLMKVYCRFFL